MTPTPRTYFAFDGDLSVGVQPEIKTWEEAKDFARQLETELIALQDELKRIYEAVGYSPTMSSVQCYEHLATVTREERDQLLATVEGLKHAGEMLWTVIANVNEGNWDKQSYDWRVAAARWRDNYFNTIKSIPPTNLVKRSVLERTLEMLIVANAYFTGSPNNQARIDKTIKEAREELQRTEKK